MNYKLNYKKYKNTIFILLFLGISISIATSMLLKNNQLFTNSIVSNSNSNQLFSDKKITLNLKNDNITNLSFDAKPSDNKIYLATKNFIFNIDTTKSINITDNNYLKNDTKDFSLFVNLLPYISKNNNSYVDQMIFDKNNNMFFDYKNTNTNFTNNLFVKNVKSTNNNPFKIVLPPNVDAVSYFSVSYDGKYIVIRSKNTNQIYISLIPKNFLSKFEWVNIPLPNKTDNLYLSYFAFDNNNNLYITNKDTIYIINSNLLVYNINLSNKIKLPFITSIANIDLKSGIQIHINQNNKILLSTSFKNNSTTYNNYFYTTKTSDVLTKPSSYVIANNDYVDTKNKNNTPYFNYNSAKLGIKDSITLLNNGIDTHNVVGLYYSPTGVPIKKIKDSSNKNNIGTFAMYGGETITQGNTPIVSAVNRFDNSLNKVAFASLNSVAIGNYNSNTILASGPKDYNQFNKTFTTNDIIIIAISIGCVVTIFGIGGAIIITIFIIKILTKPLSTGNLASLIDKLTNAEKMQLFNPDSIASDTEIENFDETQQSVVYNRVLNIIRNGALPSDLEQFRSDIKWLKYLQSDYGAGVITKLRVSNANRVANESWNYFRSQLNFRDAQSYDDYNGSQQYHDDLQTYRTTPHLQAQRAGLKAEEIENFNINDYIQRATGRNNIFEQQIDNIQVGEQTVPEVVEGPFPFVVDEAGGAAIDVETALQTAARTAAEDFIESVVKDVDV